MRTIEHGDDPIDAVARDIAGGVRRRIERADTDVLGVALTWRASPVRSSVLRWAAVGTKLDRIARLQELNMRPMLASGTSSVTGRAP